MNTLEILESLIGRNFEEVVDDIICAFDTDDEVIVKDSENFGYDKIAYINNEDSTQYTFVLDDTGNIKEVYEH